MNIDRRKFVKTSVTLLSGISLTGMPMPKNGFKPIRFGIVTDPHYAQRSPTINRYYNESLDKMLECVDLMNQQKVNFLIELGDFKDQGNPPREAETLEFLATIENAFSLYMGPRYHVLGNHDHDSISKKQFLDRITNEGFPTAKNYYSFNKNSFHFIVLDANYTSQGIPYDHGNFDWKDAHVPDEQINWLKRDLHKNSRPTIVFIHQRLDTHAAKSQYCPDNADVLRKILEDCGKVMVVFQGHDHKGDVSTLNGIHYYTLKAVIEGSGPENNNYAIVEIGKDLVVRVEGFRKTKSQNLI